MRRKKDDKRVLRPGNGRKNNSRGNGRNRRLIPKMNKKEDPWNSNLRNRNSRNRNPRRKKKRDTKFVLMMIIILVAFVIGAGIGVLFSFDDGSDDAPHIENVTKEMTTNLNDTPKVVFDENDDVDFNENATSKLNVNYTYSDYTSDDYSNDDEM